MNANTASRTVWPHRAVALGLVCLLMLLSFLPAGQAQASMLGVKNLYVSTASSAWDAIPAQTNYCTDQSSPCKTIQHAVDIAGDGDTIYLYSNGGFPVDYTFEEQVTVNKNNLTIFGVRPMRDGKIAIDAGGAAGIGGSHNSVIRLQTGAKNFTLRNIILQNAVANMNGGGLNSAWGSSGQILLQDVIVQNNTVDATHSGGGIFIQDCSLVLENVKIQGNTSGYSGGGLSFIGQADIPDTDYDSLTITNSIFSNNTAGTGGGLYAQGISTIANSTFSGNYGFGGGVYAIGQFATVSLTNVTITGNTAPYSGAGIVADTDSVVFLDHVTIAKNSTQSNSYAEGIVSASSLHLKNTIIAGMNADSLLCSHNQGSNFLVSDGHNLADDMGDNTCNLTAAFDLLTLDAKLGPLANNGGYTQTIALLPGSPAIDAADSSGPATDQRGKPRDNGDYSGKKVADIGAFEFQVPNHNYMPYSRR